MSANPYTPVRPLFERLSIEAADLTLLVGDAGRGWLRSLCLSPEMRFHRHEKEVSADLTGVPGWPGRVTVHLYGKAECVDKFLRAARDAGALLPKAEWPGLTSEHFREAWITFVVGHARRHPGNVLLPADLADQRDCDQLMIDPAKASLAAIDAADLAAAVAPADDDDFMPVMALKPYWDETFTNYKQLERAIKAAGDAVRTRRPSSQRLEIHVADLVRLVESRRKGTDALDLPGETIDAIAEGVRRRTAELKTETGRRATARE